VHEAGLTLEMLELVCEKAAGRRVARVILEIGEPSALLPDAVRFCFELCSEGTPAEGARLEFRRTAGEELKLVAMELA